MSRRMLDLPEFSASIQSVDDGEQGFRGRASHLRALSQTIEGDIIPRLLLAHGGGARIGPAVASRPVHPEEVAQFADLLLSRGADRCIDFAETMVADGVSLEALFLTLFAPTARILGVFWTEDLRTFTDVTIALVGLQRVLRHFASAFDEDAVAPAPRRALLVPAPGEQHTFGLFMVEMFMHRAGWDVEALPAYDPSEVRGALRGARFDIVGVSCSCDRFADGVEEAVRLVRREVSAELPVIGGGQVFIENPQLGECSGLDAVATDAFAAVDAAARLVPLAERRRRLS